MDKNYNLSLYNDKPGIELQYVEQSFSPTENTGVTLYDKYKISIMLTSGMFAVTENIAYKAETGDVFVFRPDEIHFAKIVDTKVHKFLNLFIPTNFFEELLLDTKEIQDFLEHKDGKNLIRPSLSEKEKLISLTQEISSTVKNNESLLKFDVFSKVLKVLSLLSRYYKNTSQTEKDIPKTVLNTLDYISKNYGSKITLEEISKESFCSVAYLSKIFKKYTGYTVYEQLLNVRIINAKIMLKEGKSVTEVTFDCGFSDCSHFIKTFKKLTGLTPYQYKKSE